MKKYKSLIVIILLLSALIISFVIPKSKHPKTNFISQLEIPNVLSEWQGIDVTEKLDIDVKDDRYNFIGNALAYKYEKKNGKALLFIILDAGNFHHPNVCFTSSGFKLKELDDTDFHLANRTLKTHTIYTELGTESFLVFYWISIDKNIAHDWIEQKFKQLYFSLLNKKRVGLMFRVDIPIKEENIDDALILAKQFLDDLSKEVKPEQADYIFGRQ